MEKKMNNKGFSLVELIIVVAIMAVLIGVLAPAYLQYVEKSKRTTDCSAVGSVLDAFEIVAADPAITWATSDSKSVTIDTTGANYANSSDTVLKEIDAIAAGSDTKISGSWAEIKFTATKQTNGTVEFSNTTTNTANMTNAEITKISPALANRLE